MPFINTVAAFSSLIVPGFGQFSLDDLHTFEKLTENELRLVKECLKDEEFWCAKCNDSFLYNGKKNKLEIKKIKQILFDEEYNDE